MMVHMDHILCLMDQWVHIMDLEDQCQEDRDMKGQNLKKKKVKKVQKVKIVKLVKLAKKKKEQDLWKDHQDLWHLMVLMDHMDLWDPMVLMECLMVLMVLWDHMVLTE